MKHFVITIDSDHPDADDLVRQGIVNMLCDLDWEDDERSTTIVGLLDHRTGDLPIERYECEFLAGWKLPPDEI